MARIVADRWIDAPVPVVWAVITDPDVYASVAPNLAAVEIVEGDGEGMVRRCVDTDGNEWTETCHYWEEHRGFGVRVDTATSPFHRRLFSSFEGEWRVDPVDGGVRVSIRFDFEPRYGPLGRLIAWYFRLRAPGIVEPIFDGWAAEIDARLADLGDADPGLEPMTTTPQRSEQ